MSRKCLAVLLVLTAMFSMAFGAQAQGGGPHIVCGELSEADCNILVQAQQATMDASSVAFDMSMDFGIASSDPEIGTFDIGVSAVGAIAADADVLAMFEQMSPETMSEMMTAGPEMMTDLVNAVTGEVTLTVNLPAEMAAKSGMPMDTLSLEMLMNEGVFYINVAKLLPAEEMGEMPGWIGIDLGGMLGMIVPEAMAEMGELEGMEELFQSEAFQNLSRMDEFGDFATVVRAEDIEYMGQTMAVFNTTVDYDAIFASEQFQAYMEAVVEMQEGMDEDLPENLAEVMTSLMSDMSLEVTEWIGLDDFYSYHTELVMDFEPDFEALKELDADLDMADVPEQFSMSFNMVLNLSDFNVPVEVTVPEGAQVINPLMFMGDLPSTSG